MLTLVLTGMLVANAGAPRQGGAAACPGDVNADATVNVADLLAVIGAWGEHGVTRTIEVSNYQFDPTHVNARVRDEIKFINTFGLHTATSGEACSGDGRFAFALSSSAPVASYVLEPSDVGTIGYFCDPHCGLGMTGTIAVAPFATEITGDGTVNVQDLLAVIGAWGACP